jgi:hypothetical protein
VTKEEKSPKRRPIGVWVISAFYLLSLGVSSTRAARFLSGAKISPVQEATFALLTGVDWFFFWASTVLMLSAVVCLFLLRRITIALFSVVLALNVASTIILLMRTNWAELLDIDADVATGSLLLMGGIVLWGLLFSFFILVAVIVYSRSLAKRGVLT